MYLPKGKYCVYPRMSYSLAMVMPPPPHFGWPKMNFDRIPRHFREIRNFDFFSQNGCRRPIWMSENHFLSHFSPFQLNTHILFCFTKWLPAAIWMTENHFRSHFSPFQINMQLLFFSQNGCRRSFWMSENHFWSHFSPFQINTELFFLHKMAFDDRKSLLIAFLAISDQYATFIIFSQNGCRAAILDDRRSLSNAFLAISDQYATFLFKLFFQFHFGSPICAKNNRVLPLCVINGYAKYEVDGCICDTVRDVTSFLNIFIQNGHQRPFCFSDWWQKS